MYKALLKNVPINILSDQYGNHREWLKSDENKELFVCPFCLESVTLHWAIPTKRSPHFKHRKKTNCIYEQHGEGPKHMEGKKKLYYYFVQLLSHKAKTIELEEYIPETGQIADIFIEFNNGVKWAIEYQRSNIPPSEIIKRKELYKLANIRDIWIVGENVIRELGLSTCSISNVGQALLNSFCDETSLVSFEPDSNQVTIYRSLNSLNDRTFTYNKIYSYPLQQIGFNLWGQIFCLDDSLDVKNRVSFNDYVEKSISFSLNIKDLYKGDVPGYKFKVRAEEVFNKIESDQIPEYVHINIPSPLDHIVPVEMKSIILSGFFLHEHRDNFQRNQLVITGLIRSHWEEILNNKTRNKLNSINIMDRPIVQGIFLWSLKDIYENKYQTEKEFHFDLEYINKAQPIPFSLQNKRFKKYGMIDKEFNIEDNDKSISLEYCLLILLKIAKFHVNPKNVIDVAIDNNIIQTEELESVFTLKILDKIVKRVKGFIPISEHYHGFNKEGVGLFQ